MGVLLIDGGTAIAAFVCLYSRPKAVLGLLIASMMLVPSTLVAPHMLTSYATVNHILIGAAAVRLAVMAKQGGHSRLFTATPFHHALALLVLAWVADGLAFAPPSGIPTVALQRLINLAFVAGFFIVALAFCRMIDNPRFVVRVIIVTFAVSAVAAVLEYLSKQSIGQHVFTLAGEAGSTTASHVLEARDGHVRVRSSAEFALAYAWLAVMVLPLLTMSALRMRKWLITGGALILLSLGAIYWTYARSAAAAVPVVFVLLAMLLLQRRAIMLASTGVLASAALYFFDAGIRHHLSVSADVGSVGVRFQRLPPILDAVSHHSYLGLGIGGLQTIGVSTTDNFYLYAYGDTGAVGAAILIVMCVTALMQSGRGMLLADTYRRSVVAACFVGVVAFLVSGLLEDALLLSQPAELVMLLLALATATQEPELGTLLMPKWSFRRIVFFSAAGALAGLVALLIATVCQVANDMEPSLPDVHISCLDDYGAAGVGTMRISSPTSKQTLHAYEQLTATLHQTSYLAYFDTQAKGPPIAARASIWRTAPASGAALGAAIGFVAPLPLRRRRGLAPPDRGPVRYRFAPIFG
jgi:hypothetical protein